MPGVPGQSCRSCLVRIADPAVADVPVRPECPRCRSPFTAFGIDRQGSVVHCCSRCHGLFVPPRAWCSLVATPALAAEVCRRLPGAPVPASALVQFVPCPTCGKQMERGRFAASSGVVIDVCHDHGVWLDGGELGAVVDHAARRAAGRAASTEPGQVIVREIVRAPAPPPRASALTQVKRVLTVFALVLLLARVYWMVSARGANVSSHGHDSVRAAEGANTALGR